MGGQQARLRETHVVLGESPPFPAVVATPLARAGLGLVRPYFTRRTVQRILDHLGVGTTLSNADDVEDLGLPPEFLTYRWDGRVLVLGGPDAATEKRILPRADGRYALLTRRDWFEIRPQWRGAIRHASHLIKLLVAETPNGIPLSDAIKATVPTVVLVDALANSPSPDITEQLIRMLAARPEPEAAEAISLYLAATDPFVRAEAAHAFEHRGVGPYVSELLQAARVEQRDDVLQLQVRALGTADPVDAPVVIAWLDGLRGRAAGNLALGRALRVALEGLGIPAADLPDHLGGAIIGPDRRSRRNVG